MQSKPDHQFLFICHVVDHFSKFHLLFPPKTKSAKEVTQGLIELVLSVFGLPSVLQSGNGSEFMNETLRSTIILWPGKCKIINGSPGHSQSQGLVEQGNRTIELMISASDTDNGSTEWAKWLPEIQCKYFC